MRIGIDLDGVIFDTEKVFRTYSEIYDVNVLKRNSIIENSETIAMDVLKNNNMNFFTAYHWDISDKKDICNSKNIDILIDDYDKECLEIASSKTKVIYLKDAPSPSIIGNKNIKTLYNWGEIYRYIKNNNI